MDEITIPKKDYELLKLKAEIYDLFVERGSLILAQQAIDKRIQELEKLCQQ